MEVLLKCGRNQFLSGSAKLGFRLARNGLSSATSTTHHATKNDVIGGHPNSAGFCSKCGSRKRLNHTQVSFLTIETKIILWNTVFLLFVQETKEHKCKHTHSHTQWHTHTHTLSLSLSLSVSFFMLRAHNQIADHSGAKTIGRGGGGGGCPGALLVSV